jgi:hypothetical protein
MEQLTISEEFEAKMMAKPDCLVSNMDASQAELKAMQQNMNASQKEIKEGKNQSRKDVRQDRSQSGEDGNHDQQTSRDGYLFSRSEGLPENDRGLSV